MRSSNLDIKTTVRRALLVKGARRLLFDAMKKHVLGDSYELSLVICGDTLARAMNRKYRKKGYAANVLSFPLSKKEGEIFLNVRAAEREASKYGVSASDRAALLFVHGLFHLKGLKHGTQMEAAERRVLKRFGYVR